MFLTPLKLLKPALENNQKCLKKLLISEKIIRKIATKKKKNCFIYNY